MALSEIPLGSELTICALFGLIWVIGKVMQLLHCSPLLGYIVAGVLVGPALGGFFPYVASFKVLGNIGVMLFVVEGGLSLQFSQVREVGVRAFVAAFMGVLMPILFIVGYLGAMFSLPISAALAAGAALAPTSMGFSAQLLDELGELKSEFGTLVTVTAIFDDVIAIVVLAEILAMAAVANGETLSGNPNWDLAAPVVGSVLSILVGLLLSSSFGIPLLVVQVSDQIPKGRVRTQAVLGMLLVVAIAYAFVCSGVGSSALLGCFLAGLTFSSISDVHQTWDRQLGRFVQWGLRLFFACTIGFSIPPLMEQGGVFSSGTIVGRGVVLAFLGLLGKMFVGIFAKPMGDVIAAIKFGLAMNGRGEFSFLIASQAHATGLLETEFYSSVVLGIVLVTLVTPFGYRLVVFLERKYFKVENHDEEADAEGAEDDEDDDGASIESDNANVTRNTQEVIHETAITTKRFSPHPPPKKTFAPDADDDQSSDEDDVVGLDEELPDIVAAQETDGLVLEKVRVSGKSSTTNSSSTGLKYQGASSASVPNGFFQRRENATEKLHRNQRVFSAPARQLNVVIDNMQRENETTDQNEPVSIEVTAGDEDSHKEEEEKQFMEAGAGSTANENYQHATTEELVIELSEMSPTKAPTRT